ncbi:hypothetical protein E4U58_006742 [Claviceps cyperi]|nr:hypothetical protein E4U58_006742 [Claviceps cyperi]
MDLSGWLSSYCVDPVEIDSGKKVLTSAAGLKINQPSQNDRTTDAHSVQKRMARAFGLTR